MKSKLITCLFLVLCFIMSVSGLYAGEEQKAGLTVNKIAFTRDKDGRERVALSCNQACVPELFTLEDANPRVVMDVKGVSLIRVKQRNVDTGGKLVKRVRNYLDKKTTVLRVVLDLERSKFYIVHPMQDPSDNAYVLTISERKPGGSKNAKGPSLSQERRITILRPDLKPEDQETKLQEATASPERDEEQETKPQEAAAGPERTGDAKAATDAPSVDRGRSQLNAGEFAAAVDTFTKILTVHPQDSLSYRLRGNAHDNLGDRQKAVEDWIRAARLGDTTIQSYLDFLQVKWREDTAP